MIAPVPTRGHLPSRRPLIAAVRPTGVAADEDKKNTDENRIRSDTEP